MMINVMVNDDEIRKASQLFLKHFKDPAFLKLVIDCKSFNHTKDSGALVARNILEFEGTVNLTTYRPFNPWTKAIAYAEKDTVYFNSRKSFPVMDRLETIAHETLHLIGYSHNGNYVTQYNLGTAPYLVSALFVKYINSIYQEAA